MGTVKNFLPRQVIGSHRRASALKAIHNSLTGRDFWREAGGENARRVNVRRVRLTNDPTADYDLAPGQQPTTPYVLLPTYSIGWFSIEPTDFTQYLSQREYDLRAEARAIYDAEYVALQLKPNPTADDRERMKVIEARGAQLADDGQGYVNTIYDAMGTRAKGVWYGLAAGNVPLHWEYVKSLKANRAISFRVKRLEAPERQGNYDYALVIGKNNTKTLYALVFGRDKEIKWRHYRKITKKRRETLELQLAEALDAGRLTAADEAKLMEWDAEHARINEAAKGRKKTPVEEARLAGLKKAEDDLRDQKKFLSDAGRAIVEEIEAELFYDQVTVAVPEFVKTTIGQPVDVTIEWLRRGGVLITVGDNEPFVWFNTQLTKTKKYGTVLEKGSRLEIRSSGGKWALAMGAPIYDDEALLYSAPYTLPPGAAGSIQFVADASPGPLVSDPAAGHWQNAEDPALAGAYVRASLVTVFPGLVIPELGLTMPTLYQTRLELHSSGDYAAEVHNLDLIIIPDVPALGPTIYDSEQHKDSKGVAHFIDLQVNALEGNAVVCNCFYRDGLLPNGTRESGLPDHSLVGRLTDIMLLTEGDALAPPKYVTWRGKIQDDNYDDLQSLAKDTGTTTPLPGAEPNLKPMPNAASFRQLTVVGLEQAANKLADAQVSVNGLNLGDALILCARLAGYQPDEYGSLPVGPIPGIDPLPLAIAGELPTLKPDDTANWLEFMRRLVKDHAPGYELATGYDLSGAPGAKKGFYLRSLEEVNRPDLNYTEDAPIDSDLRILKGLRLRADLSDFHNRVVVIGAVSEETKKRIQKEERLPHSTDPRYEGVSLCYVGDDYPLVIGPNDSIDSEEAAILLARKFLDKKGRPPIYSPLSVPFRDDVEEGQLIYVKGRQWLLERKERANINSGEGMQRMDLYLRLAKDGIKPE